MLETRKLFLAARSHHQGGRLEQARDLSCRVLAADPGHAGAWQILGLIARGAGDLKLGVRCLEQAAALARSEPQYHCNLGAVYLEAGRPAEAEESCRKALRLRPYHLDAQNNLGVALLCQGRFEAARDCFEAILRVRPTMLDARKNLALAHVRLGRCADGEREAREALRLAPDDPVTLTRLGMALAGLGRTDDMLAAFRRVIELDPTVADAYLFLGMAFKERGCLQEAADFLRRGAELAPTSAEAHVALGNVLSSQDRPDEAVACYRKALGLQPGDAGAHNCLGVALRAQNQFDQARACYETAVRLQPDHAIAHGNLANLLLDMGQVEEAETFFLRSLALRPQEHRVHSNYLFCTNHSLRLGAAEVLAEHRKWEKVHAAWGPFLPHRNDPAPDRRLRIGYLSGDFRNHAAAKFFGPILARHDRERFEITCYSEWSRPDHVTAQLRSLAHRWRPTYTLSDAELDILIRGDGIDVLVDMSGHTAGNRLRALTYRPAPVQVTYLGYLNTTGLTSVDYLLTDDVLHPPGSPSYTTEELFRLPRGYYCFDAGEGSADVGPLPARARGHVTFGSFQSLAKLNGHVLDLWARVLHALPTSRLLLFRDSLEEQARDRFRQALAARGIPAERLDLRQGHSGAGYLAVCNEIDVCLDTFPYSGGTTTCESLWMGVPVIALPGDRMFSRTSAMVLTRLGLPELIARTPEDYVAIARHLASSLDHLAGLRAGLRQRMRATLCDAAGVTRGLEEAYREMWRRWCAKR
jgi:predicted O-linked N-acetylglucosamine transferase (SPINDLY family)